MIRKFHFSQFLFLAAFTALLAACSTAKITDQEAQRLRSMTPAPGTALVYFVRPMAGATIRRFRVTCDGRPIGLTNGKRYIYTMLKPGKHDFISKAENKDELSIVLNADSTYFIEQIPQMGLFSARNVIKRMDEVTGRKKLSKCKLSGDCPAYTNR